MEGRVLVVASSKEVAAKAWSEEGDASEDTTTVMVEASSIAGTDLAPSTFNGVHMFIGDVATLRLCTNSLQKCFDAMNLGGVLTVHCESNNTLNDSLQWLGKELMYTGFVDITTTKIESKDCDRYPTKFACKKPDWQFGIVSSAKVEGDDELIDERVLIDANEQYEKLGPGKESCAAKPRACANCNCGRKELEVQLGAEEAKRRLEKGTVRSSCGSCYRGDAFRCANCPYLGMPAFKPGEKVELDMDFCNSNEPDGSSGDTATVATSDGKIKLTA